MLIKMLRRMSLTTNSRNFKLFVTQLFKKYIKVLEVKANPEATATPMERKKTSTRTYETA
jgi:hypothetical protein